MALIVEIMAQEKSWLRFALKKVVELLLEVKWIRLASKTIDDGLYLRKTYTDKLKHEFNLKFNREYRYEYYLKLDIGCSAQQLCFNPETSETLTSLCHKTRLIRDARLSDCSETGYPNVSLDAVIAYNAGAVRALFAAVGLSQEELDKYLLPTIRRVAAMVHLLPASGGYHHKECGGLLEHSLEVAWKAAQNGKRAYFSDDPANPNKAENQRKWLLATVLGALCHDCGKVLSDVVVRDAALTGDKYPAFTGTSLAEWLEGKGCRRYYVYWKGNGKEHENQLVHLYRDLIPVETNRYLGDMISGDLAEYFRMKLPKGKMVLNDIITEADAESTARDREQGHYDRSQGRQHDRECQNFFAATKNLILFGLRHKSSTGESIESEYKGFRIRGWTINTSDSALMYTFDEKLFVDWRQLPEIRKILRIENVSSDILNINPNRKLQKEGKNQAEPDSIEKEFEKNDIEGELFALLKELKDGGYVDKNDFGGTYDNETLIWQVGRFDTAQPGNDIITYKAICLNAKAINEIFQDLTKLPRPVPAYALYDPKHDETLLLFKEKTTTQTPLEPQVSSDTNENSEAVSNPKAALDAEVSTEINDSNAPDNADGSAVSDATGKEQETKEAEEAKGSSDKRDESQETVTQRQTIWIDEDGVIHNGSSTTINEEEVDPDDIPDPTTSISGDDSECEDAEIPDITDEDNESEAMTEEISGTSKKEVTKEDNDSEDTDEKEEATGDESEDENSGSGSDSEVPQNSKDQSEEPSSPVGETNLESTGTRYRKPLSGESMELNLGLSNNLTKPKSRQHKRKKAVKNETPNVNSAANPNPSVNSFDVHNPSSGEEDGTAEQSGKKPCVNLSESSVSAQSLTQGTKKFDAANNEVSGENNKSEADSHSKDSGEQLGNPQVEDQNQTPRRGGAEVFLESQNSAAPPFSSPSVPNSTSFDTNATNDEAEIQKVIDQYMGASPGLEEITGYCPTFDDGYDDVAFYEPEQPYIVKSRPWKLNIFSAKDEQGRSVQYKFELKGDEPEASWQAEVLIPDGLSWPFEPDPRYRIKHQDVVVRKSVKRVEVAVKPADDSALSQEEEKDTQSSKKIESPGQETGNVAGTVLSETDATDIDTMNPDGSRIKRYPFELKKGEKMSLIDFISALADSINCGRASPSITLSCFPDKGYYITMDQLKELAFLASGGDEAVSEKYASWIPARIQYESLFYDRDLQCVFQKKR